MHLRAARRNIKLKQIQIETPCTVPSYSSRARPPEPLQMLLDKTLKQIDAPILLSAYDLYHHAGLGIAYDVFAEIDESPTPVLMLDSGGYELIWNDRAVRAGMFARECVPHWSEDLYFDLLTRWDEKKELVAVTYDDETKMPMPKQLVRAQGMAERFPWLTVDLLLKPIEKNSPLKVSDIAPFIKDLSDFAILGVTEKELGASMSERLICLAELRDCLAGADLHIPIHVFGGLDPSMTPLYFMAGADVFDGLSWLRYAFTSAGSCYEQAHLSLAHPTADLERASFRQRRSNLAQLSKLQKSMALVADGAPIQEAFGERSPDILQAWEKAWSKA